MSKIIVRRSTRKQQTDDPWRIRERCYEEPFSRIVKVKSPRVWDVICSTLVLYRSTAGLDRGVGVFKGDYTQRQGWLYWRTPPAVLTRNSLSLAGINILDVPLDKICKLQLSIYPIVVI